MYYRTRTYIAADWTEDHDAVEQLHKWNDNNYWSLSFTDAHDLMQAKDSSLNCSIKKSLKQRLDASKTFVLIVGKYTSSLRSGKCSYCYRYHSVMHTCSAGYSVDNRSFIEYECEKAIEAGINIVVLYNSTQVLRTKCPEAIRSYGTHIPMKHWTSGGIDWDYQAVKKALQ